MTNRTSAARLAEIRAGAAEGHSRDLAQDRRDLLAEIDSLKAERTTVWAVRFANYEPAEIVSIHASEASANAKRDELNAVRKERGDWAAYEVSEWEVEP